MHSPYREWNTRALKKTIIWSSHILMTLFWKEMLYRLPHTHTHTDGTFEHYSSVKVTVGIHTQLCKPHFFLIIAATCCCYGNPCWGELWMNGKLIGLWCCQMNSLCVLHWLGCGVLLLYKLLNATIRAVVVGGRDIIYLSWCLSGLLSGSLSVSASLWGSLCLSLHLWQVLSVRHTDSLTVVGWL